MICNTTTDEIQVPSRGNDSCTFNDVAMNTPEPDDRGLVLACPQCGQGNRMAYERLGQKFPCGKCHTDLRPPAEPIDLKSEAVFDPMTGRSALPILVDFWALWCGPAETCSS
jgi:hypothetical protein